MMRKRKMNTSIDKLGDRLWGDSIRIRFEKLDECILEIVRGEVNMTLEVEGFLIFTLRVVLKSFTKVMIENSEENHGGRERGDFLERGCDGIEKTKHLGDMNKKTTLESMMIGVSCRIEGVKLVERFNLLINEELESNNQERVRRVLRLNTLNKREKLLIRGNGFEVDEVELLELRITRTRNKVVERVELCGRREGKIDETFRIREVGRGNKNKLRNCIRGNSRIPEISLERNKGLNKVRE